MAMHSGFPDWYRSVALAPQATTLELRWAGIEELSREATGTLLLALARLFGVPSTPEMAVPADFREAFKKHDTSFPLRDNLQELRILAGATLRTIIEEDGDMAPLAALAMVCGAFGPRLPVVPEPEHVETAESFLIRLSSAAHSTPLPDELSVPSFTKAKFGKTLTENLFAQPASLRDPLLTTLHEFASTLASSLEQAGAAIAALTRVVRVREEEVNILWWLHSRFSAREKKPFSEIGYVAGALQFPLELAALTLSVPGPESISAILARSLQEGGAPSSFEPITIASATNALSRRQREHTAELYESSVQGSLTPILLAIRKSLETDGTDDWFPVYRKVCEVPLDHPFPALSLSLQLYREVMLVRASNEAK
jgi:hypothetical protein